MELLQLQQELLDYEREIPALQRAGYAINRVWIKAQKLRIQKVSVDFWAGLEDFRASLPLDGELDFQHEKYQLLTLRWDIVKAKYLLTKISHDQGIANVADYMEVLGLPKVAPAPYTLSSSFYYIDEKRVMDDKIDLKIPVLIAHVIEGAIEGDTLIDGLHRVVKAYRTGVEALFAYKLTHVEEMLCRI